MNSKPFQVVDLFAGPGGLGEGFSSVDDGRAFDIIVSAEMDPAARETLRLRAFYRALKKYNPEALGDYYYYCETAGAAQPWTQHSKKQWDEASQEARQIRLGSLEGNAELDAIIDRKLDVDRPWVLIGGPPCQAYSIVGRARNRGNSEYRAEEDPRHFLYKEYLRIIQKNRPAVFVMENVKGILSSKVGGELIFPKILADLADPDAALGMASTGAKYKIFSLASEDAFDSECVATEKLDFSNFVIRAEKFGIPQARHRVILVGVAEEYADVAGDHQLREVERQVTLKQAIGGLPPLRSTVTKIADTQDSWTGQVLGHLKGLSESLKISVNYDPKLDGALSIYRNTFKGGQYRSGALRLKKDSVNLGRTGCSRLDDWYIDNRLSVWLNHEARGHMSSDLRRYVYASVFATVHKRSPKGHEEFHLAGLAPDHKNWESGKFCDRFKVQLASAPSSTITSHISKDGHHFIHPDPHQCRSLSVREAARLQTFPDNYFFLGTRTQQYHQVGNAVPPLLASKIGVLVKSIIETAVAKKKQAEAFVA